MKLFGMTLPNILYMLQIFYDPQNLKLIFFSFKFPPPDICLRNGILLPIFTLVLLEV